MIENKESPNTIKKFIKDHNVDFYSKYNGTSLLRETVLKGSRDTVNLILEAEIEENRIHHYHACILGQQEDDEGIDNKSSILYHLLWQEIPDYYMAELLISYDVKAYSPLHHATYKNDFEKVKLLIKEGHPIDILSFPLRKTPLQICCMNGEAKIAEYLIKSGANVSKNKNGRILKEAVIYGNLSVLKLLLQLRLPRSFNINSSLFSAITFLEFDIAKILIAEGADVNGEIRHQSPLIHLCCTSPFTLTTAFQEKEFLALSSPYENGVTYPSKTLIKLLKRNNIKNKYLEEYFHQTLKEFERRKKYLELLELLIEKGAHVNKQDRNGQTPLHWACHRKDYYVIQYLLKNGADVNIQTSYGKTPFETFWSNFKHFFHLLESKRKNSSFYFFNVEVFKFLKLLTEKVNDRCINNRKTKKIIERYACLLGSEYIAEYLLKKIGVIGDVNNAPLSI